MQNSLSNAIQSLCELEY